MYLYLNKCIRNNRLKQIDIFDVTIGISYIGTKIGPFAVFFGIRGLTPFHPVENLEDYAEML